MSVVAVVISQSYPLAVRAMACSDYFLQSCFFQREFFDESIVFRHNPF